MGTYGIRGPKVNKPKIKKVRAPKINEPKMPKLRFGSKRSKFGGSNSYYDKIFRS